jgi:exoribonuclease-2
VRVRINGTDLLTLDVHASVLQRLDDPSTAADDAVIDDSEDQAAAGPLTLAIDVADDGKEAPADEPAVASAPAV